MGKCSSKFDCGICLETKRGLRKYFRDCKHLKHFCCKQCMKRYLKEKIESGVIAISCPYPNCTSLASERGIKSCLSRRMMAKYYRFKRMKEDPTFRECPRCRNEMVFDVISHEMVKACGRCGAFSCYVHGEAHDGQPCEAYVNQEDGLSTALIRRVCQNCPRCNSPTEKINGCNNMYCSRCNSPWQWSSY